MNYDEKKEKKKWKTIKIISAVVVLVLGTVFGIIAIYLNNWDLVRFFKDYRVWLVILVAIAMEIVIFSFKEVK